MSDCSSDVCSSDRKNPWARVPALQIGDDVLTENIAILNHIAELVPEKALLPTEGIARARALEWLAMRLCCKDWRQSEVGGRSAPIRRLLRNGGRACPWPPSATRAQCKKLSSQEPTTSGASVNR